jgi:hypothetical protein
VSGFRVEVDLHHLDDQADAREWMLVFNGWQVWRLTADEARRLSADLLLGLAGARGNDAQPIDAGHPDVWPLCASEPF